MTDSVAIAANFHDVLADLARDMDVACTDRWVLIGSGAAHLLGAAVEVADIDLLVSERDAKRLMQRWASCRQPVQKPDGDRLFRSCFARYLHGGWRVEVMADLEVFGKDGWSLVRVEDTVLVACHGTRVRIPWRAAQIDLLERFGRAKDRPRATLLRTGASA